jgi:hypothetical protein
MHATVRRYMPKDADSKEGRETYRLLVRAYVPPDTLDQMKAHPWAQFTDDISNPSSDRRVVVGDQDAVLRDIYSKSFPHQW